MRLSTTVQALVVGLLAAQPVVADAVDFIAGDVARRYVASSGALSRR